MQSQGSLAITDVTEQVASGADDARWEHSDSTSAMVVGFLTNNQWKATQESSHGGCLMDIDSTMSVADTTLALGLESFRSFAQNKDALDKKMIGQEATISRLMVQVKGLLVDKKTVEDECR